MRNLSIKEVIEYHRTMTCAQEISGLETPTEFYAWQPRFFKKLVLELYDSGHLQVATDKEKGTIAIIVTQKWQELLKELDFRIIKLEESRRGGLR